MYLFIISTLAIDTDEVTRILRASHDIGVLGELLSSQPPSDTRIEQAYTSAMSRLAHYDMRPDPHRSPLKRTRARAAAERALKEAYYKLRNPSARKRVHQRLVAAERPVTHHVRCPVDIRALREYANSAAGLTVGWNLQGYAWYV